MKTDLSVSYLIGTVLGYVDHIDIAIWSDMAILTLASIFFKVLSASDL